VLLSLVACVGKLCEPVNVCGDVGFNRAYTNKLKFTNAVVATVLLLVPGGCVVVVKIVLFIELASTVLTSVKFPFSIVAIPSEIVIILFIDLLFIGIFVVLLIL
jgi:hypothetical protein